MAILVSLLCGGGGEVCETEGNGYTRLTTTLWSLSICRWVSLARIQHLFQGVSMWLEVGTTEDSMVDEMYQEQGCGWR